MKKILVASIFFLFLIAGCKDEGPEPVPPVPVVAITSMSGTVNVIDSTTVVIGASDDKGVIRVELYINNLLDSSRIFLHPPYVYPWNVKNLADSSLYTLFARAYDADGNVSTSAIVVARILRFAPNTLRFAFLNDTAAVLSWNNPSSIAKGFEIEDSHNGINFSHRQTVFNDTNTAVVIDSFYNDSTYFFRVRAITASTKSSYTNTVSRTVHFLPPQNVRITYMDEDSAKVEWDDTLHLAQNYTMYTSTDGRTFSKQPHPIPSTYRSIKIWNTYQTIKNYYFRMIANSNINVSDSSNTAFQSLNFPAPYFLSVVFANSNAVRLHWQDTAIFGSFFHLEMRVNNGPYNDVTSEPKDSGSVTFHYAYQTKNTYSFRLYLSSNLNTTEYSDSVKVYFLNELYTGGSFSVAGSQPVNNVAKWNGASWGPIGDGIAAPVFALHKFNERMFAGGKQVISAWDGSSWDNSSVGSITGTNDYIYSMTDTNGQMVAGGTFAHLQNAQNGIARWLGSDWNSLGPGMDGPVYSVAYYNNFFYAAGKFGTAGNQSVNNIAIYNNTNGWASVGNGLIGSVFSTTVFNNKLYAGGTFTDTSSAHLNYLAAWDGTNWTSAASTGILGLDSIRIYATAVFNNQLYVAGRFSTINGVGANNIATWNGFTWQPVGSGVDGVVRNLYVYNNALYASGKFQSAGGVAANNIAFWDGSSWWSLGDGISGSGAIVYSMATFGSWYWQVVH